jgi:YegS/Rv2252/BmrU family lipid kinase
MTRYKIIVNPVSGRGAGELDIPQAEEILHSLGMEYDLVRTQRPLHAIELARDSAREGYDIVVAMGGDGTANEVINGLMQAKAAGEGEAVLGLITVGRGNDFGFGIGVPHGLEASCRCLAAGKRCRIDIGKASGGLYSQGRFFGNGVGIGFDAVVGFEAAKLTFLTGFLCYLVAALRTIFLYFHAPLLRIEYDGGAIDQPALMVSVMNGRRMGGTFQMAPKSHNDDGRFTVCLAGQLSRFGILKLIPRFMAGTQAGHPQIRYLETARLSVRALQGSLAAHADGETLCTDGENLSMEILPKALEIIGG